MNVLLLILSLPTENTAARMRAWRALKSSGAAVLRDGVYLMPVRDSCRSTLDAIATDINQSGGNGHVMLAQSPDGMDLPTLFDRSEEYVALLTDIAQSRNNLTVENHQDVTKVARRLRKAFATITETDFFPGAMQGQADLALLELEKACARASAPDEPQSVEHQLVYRDIAAYQGRTWATRCRPWVDRLACAWLIRRFIDPQATILWLASPSDCPPDALGFDFDDATFTHVGNRVSFEVLQASFSLTQPELTRLGQLVHYLDVGGVQPPEAAGVESVLGGLRKSLVDDDQLLQAASAIFDGLLLSFGSDNKPQ